MSRLASKPPNPTALKIKCIARELFAARGVDGVSVRDIAEAAGQKNHAAVAYYFGSKEALVREIILDGARAIDEKRNALLDEAEARGGPDDLLEVVTILIDSSIDFGPPEEVSGYNRFFTLVDMTHREFFLEALEDRWNSGYLRCFEHLRRLTPDLPEKNKTQRLVFVGRYLGGVLSAREAQLEDTSRPHPFWEDEATLKDFAKTVVAILEA